MDDATTSHAGRLVLERVDENELGICANAVADPDHKPALVNASETTGTSQITKAQLIQWRRYLTKLAAQYNGYENIPVHVFTPAVKRLHREKEKGGEGEGA